MKGSDIAEVTIDSIDVDAFGEALLEDGTLLKIAGAAPGDRVRVRLAHKSPHRNTAWCDIVEVLSRGPHFVMPFCPNAEAAGGRCGGCPAMHLDETTVRRMKLKRVAEALRSADVTVPGISFEPSTVGPGYRNRGHFAVGRIEGPSPRNRPFLGVFAPRNRRIIEIGRCPVLRPSINDAARRIEVVLAEGSVPIHPESLGLRYVTLRASKQGEVLADLVVGGAQAPWVPPFARQLVSALPIVGVSCSVNDTSGNAVRVRPSVHLAGVKTLAERVGDLDLQLTAASFAQLNSETAAAMYRRAAMMTPPTSVLWDLYCGVGGLGLTVLSTLQPNAQLFGAEFVNEAVELATLNATPLSSRAVFETRDLSLGAPKRAPRPEVILVNPPRRGLDHAVLEDLKTSTAHTVVYMSCDPASFARDAAVLATSGFAPGEIFAHDMLPFTAHVELIAAFHRSSA